MSVSLRRQADRRPRGQSIHFARERRLTCCAGAPADILAARGLARGRRRARSGSPPAGVLPDGRQAVGPRVGVHPAHAGPLREWQVIADANSGKVLLRQSLLRYDSGRVFDPNPAVTNGGTAPWRTRRAARASSARQRVRHAHAAGDRRWPGNLWANSRTSQRRDHWRLLAGRSADEATTTTSMDAMTIASKR